MTRRITGVILLLITTLLLTNCRDNRRRRAHSNKLEHKIRKKPAISEDSVLFINPADTLSDEPQSAPSNENEGLIFVPTNKQLKPVVHAPDLPNSPKIIFKRPINIATPQEYINNYNLEGEMRELIIACDYNSKIVRNNTVALVATSPGEFNLGQICDIFDFCYSNWTYVNDPISRDYYAKASETLRNGLNGDCDDFAILICSAILAIGGEARINFAYNNESNIGHAYTEVNLGTTNLHKIEEYLRARYGYAEVWHKTEGGNVWLNLDWQASFPGGQYYKYVGGKTFNIAQNTYQNL